MKNVIELFISFIIALFVSGCKETDLGGFVFDQIYVYEDGILIDAQDLMVNIPAEGGVVEKEFVTYGIMGLRDIKKASGISAEFLSTYPAPDDEIYEVEQYLTRYKQTARFKAEPNTTKKSREAKIMIVTEGYNGYAAYVHIKQDAAL